MPWRQSVEKLDGFATLDFIYSLGLQTFLPNITLACTKNARTMANWNIGKPKYNGNMKKSRSVSARQAWYQPARRRNCPEPARNNPKPWVYPPWTRLPIQCVEWRCRKKKPFKQPPLFISRFPIIRFCSMSVVSLESKPRLAQNTDVSVQRLKRAKQTLRQVNHGHLGNEAPFFRTTYFTGTSQNMAPHSSGRKP